MHPTFKLKLIGAVVLSDLGLFVHSRERRYCVTSPNKRASMHGWTAWFPIEKFMQATLIEGMHPLSIS